MEPTRYTTKPVTIEAMRFPDESADTIETNTQAHYITDWMERRGYPALLGNALHPEALRERGRDNGRTGAPPTAGWYIRPDDGALMIRTLEVDMAVPRGGYVIRGLAGEFYPCRADVFEAKYEHA